MAELCFELKELLAQRGSLTSSCSFLPIDPTSEASLSDHAILEEYSAKADVGQSGQPDPESRVIALTCASCSAWPPVITAADCDDLEAAKAVIKGLESAAQGRLDNKQRKAVLIHTSGTGVLCDPDVPAGELDPTEVHDGDAKQIAAIPESRPHREVDIVWVSPPTPLSRQSLADPPTCLASPLSVTDAFKRGHFLGYIVLPSTIFGRGSASSCCALVHSFYLTDIASVPFARRTDPQCVDLGRLADIAQITNVWRIALATATSQQIPNAVNWALSHQRATYVEPGSTSTGRHVKQRRLRTFD